MTPRSRPVPSGSPATFDQRGTTLTELLAVTAMLALALAALLPVLWIAGQSWQRADRHSEGLHNARRAADKITRDLRAVQSFQQISATQLRFSTSLGDGSGADPIVEYRLNAATNELEHRFAASYVYRQRLTVTAGTAVAAGYSVSVVVNHAALVSAGKSLASGDDVRIRYWTGTRWVELDRVRDVTTPWNTASTRLWFRLQTALPAAGSDPNYHLYYGDLSARPPPANGDHVFLDYEDGTTLAGWARRDTCAGTHSASADGFVFQAASGSCHRQYSKNVPHNDAELFWGFWSSPTGASDGHQTGVSARRSDTGVGYIVSIADEINVTLRLRYWTTWSTTGGAIGSVAATVIPGTNYFGRFSLVGSALRVKYWRDGVAEPGWMLSATHTSTASGAHYGQVDGYAAPQEHRHRHIILRLRVADPEPSVTLSPEESGATANTFQPLAGPFRAMAVQCFDAAGGAIACASISTVRSVQVALTVMDPTGEVADYVVTSRAYRQAP